MVIRMTAAALAPQYLLRGEAKLLQGHVEHGGLRYTGPCEAGPQHQVKVALQNRQDLSCALTLRGIVDPQVSQHTCGNTYKRRCRTTMTQLPSTVKLEIDSV